MSVLGVDTLVGIPFETDGRSRTGIDCQGLTIWGLRLMGLDWPEATEEMRAKWDRGERPVAADLPAGWAAIPPETPLRRGDVFVTGIERQHMALALGDDFVLHTTEATGSYLARERTFRGRIRWLFRREGP